MKYTKKIWLSWIVAIQSQGRSLTDWEKDFVESVADQLQEWGTINEVQEKKLEEIYANRTPL